MENCHRLHVCVRLFANGCTCTPVGELCQVVANQNTPRNVCTSGDRNASKIPLLGAGQGNTPRSKIEK